jgi:murein hydrolase activator
MKSATPFPLFPFSVFLLSLLLGLPALGEQRSPEALESEARKAAERAQMLNQRAEQLVSDLANLQQELVIIANDRSRGEDAARRASSEIDRLTAREARLAARALEEEEALRRTLAAMVRMDRNRQPVLTGVSDMNDVAATASVMSAMAPAFARRAHAAERERNELARVRETLRQTRDALSLTEMGIAKRREQIARLLSERERLLSELRRDATREAERAQTLSREAANLRELITELERKRRAAPSRPAQPDSPNFKPRGITAMKGKLPLPAIGEVIAGFNEPLRDQRRPGLTIRTRRGAQVTAPADARIGFVGPFGGYGSLMLLDLGDGHYMALTGMKQIFGTVGQAVLAGEPLGEMPDDRQLAPELYIELRNAKGAFDPSGWMAQQ